VGVLEVEAGRPVVVALVQRDGIDARDHVLAGVAEEEDGLGIRPLVELLDLLERPDPAPELVVRRELRAVPECHLADAAPEVGRRLQLLVGHGLDLRVRAERHDHDVLDLDVGELLHQRLDAVVVEVVRLADVRPRLGGEAGGVEDADELLDPALAQKCLVRGERAEHLDDLADVEVEDVETREADRGDLLDEPVHRPGRRVLVRRPLGRRRTPVLHVRPLVLCHRRYLLVGSGVVEAASRRSRRCCRTTAAKLSSCSANRWPSHSLEIHPS
jgi:hypothetical protein